MNSSPRTSNEDSSMARVAAGPDDRDPGWEGHPPNQRASGDLSPERNYETLNEHSPLLSPAGQDDDQSPPYGGQDGTRTAGEDESQNTKSIWYLTLVAVGIGGLQIAWSVELSNGSPYLLSLGLSKSLMALVWIAGPLTGTLVQPYVGMLSDNCRLRIGKRKPFMLGGTVATILALLCLAWTPEIVGGLLGLFGADPESSGVKTTVLVFAVIGIYVLDFAINTVQAAIRAFIVDCTPAHQQEAANAMASRFVGLGNIVGFVAGYLNLPRTLWFLGKTQFQVLCAFASICLAATIILSVSTIRERDPRQDDPPSRTQGGLVAFFLSVFKSMRRLPPQVKRVCQVEIFSWVGFFPLLFYTTSYIGEIYIEPYLRENPNMTPAELDKLYEKATRVGTFALLVNSVVSLLTNVFMPFFIAPTYDSRPVSSIGVGESRSASKYDEEQSYMLILHRLRIPGFTLKRAWMGSLVLFAICMFCSVLVRSVQVATVLIGLAGVTWAMTLWAPWAIISAEISRRDAIARIHKMQTRSLRTGGGPSAAPVLPEGEDQLLDENGGRSPSEEDDGMEGADVDEEHDQAGVILGIHNMSISAPQIIATFGSSIIFKILQKPRGTPGDHSMAVVMALGGLFVLASTYFVAQIKESTGTVADTIRDAEQGQQRLVRRAPSIEGL
jgi:solute carrier family 45 protein 1/2/4